MLLHDICEVCFHYHAACTCAADQIDAVQPVAPPFCTCRPELGGGYCPRHAPLPTAAVHPTPAVEQQAALARYPEWEEPGADAGR